MQRERGSDHVARSMSRMVLKVKPAYSTCMVGSFQIIHMMTNSEYQMPCKSYYSNSLFITKGPLDLKGKTDNKCSTRSISHKPQASHSGTPTLPCMSSV